jgi:hypothetical protein
MLHDVIICSQQSSQARHRSGDHRTVVEGRRALSPRLAQVCGAADVAELHPEVELCALNFSLGNGRMESISLFILA